MLLSGRGNRTRNATPSTMRWSGIILVLYVCLGLVDYAESESKPPIFTKTIVNFTAAAGDEIKLTCQVRASKNTQYWWKKDGQNIDTTTKRLRYKQFRYLKIKNVKFSDAGKYTCIAKNEAREIQHTMRLYVTAPKPTSPLPEGKPFFTRPDKMDKEVLVFPAANAVKMVCDANGNPTPTVTWYKDGKIFTKRKDETYHTITPHTFTLSIKLVIPADSGIYKCNVSNKYGYINKTYKLEVQESYVTIPVMETINNVTAYIGDNVTVLCKAVSDGVPHFQLLVYNKVTKNLTVLKPKLQKNGYLLPSEGKRHGVRLFFPNVSLEDSKEYTCMAGNFKGHDYKSFYINVLPKRPTTTENPIIHGGSQEQVTDDNQTTKLIILIVIAVSIVFFGSILAFYFICVRGQRKRKSDGRNQPETVPFPQWRVREFTHSTSSSISNCSTNPLLGERHISFRLIWDHLFAQ